MNKDIAQSQVKKFSFKKYHRKKYCFKFRLYMILEKQLILTVVTSIIVKRKNACKQHEETFVL